MAVGDKVSLQPCPSCGGELNVSGLDPLAAVQCPLCEQEFRVQRVFGPYEIVEKLGEGGMGEVYRALDRSLQRYIALKILRPEISDDPVFAEKFEREARLAAAVNHPHVVRVYSFGRDAGQAYLAMELVAGGSLDDLMTRQGRLAEAQALEVGIQAAEGLRAALAAGLIHRDVKPGNLLFADAHTVKVSDFGVAKALGTEEDGDQEVWGTPYYIAPEKLDRRPEDFRSDLYSLGGTLFHALAGWPPFEAEGALPEAEIASFQALASDVSSETTRVISRMLAQEPDERFQSYDELLVCLRQAAANLHRSDERAREPAALESAPARRAGGWLALALLTLVILGATGVWVLRDRFESKDSPAMVAPPGEKPATGNPDDAAAHRKALDGQATTAKAQLPQAARPQLPRLSGG